MIPVSCKFCSVESRRTCYSCIHMSSNSCKLMRTMFLVKYWLKTILLGFKNNLPSTENVDKCIIIIIMSRYQHGYPWSSHATPPYRPLLPAGPQGYTLYRHRAAVCRFELVILPLLVHRSTSLMSSSLLLLQCLACLVRLWKFSWWVVVGHTAAAL